MIKWLYVLALSSFSLTPLVAWTAESKSSEEEEEEEDAEKDDKKPKTKTVKKTTYEWELLNDMKAIWLRNPKEVTDEEYTKFYHSLAKVCVIFFLSVSQFYWSFLFFLFLSYTFFQDFGDEKPLAWSHFTAEGDVEFKAVLFVPPKAPSDLYESYYNSNKSNLKLYVRRVFISDEFDELLPKYLNFLMVVFILSNLCYNIELLLRFLIVHYVIRVSLILTPCHWMCREKCYNNTAAWKQ